MFEWQALIDELPALLEGLLLSLTIILWGILGSFVMGSFHAYCLAIAPKSLKKVVTTYTVVFKHVPVLVVIYFFYKALPVSGIVLPPIVCGLIGICLQASAYISEVIRAALKSVGKEQWEAVVSLGLTPVDGFFKVILPQLWATLLPPLASVVVNISKNSSLLAFISVSEFFYVIYKGGVTFFHYVEFFSLGVLFYLTLNFLITFIFSKLEVFLVPQLLQKGSLKSQQLQKVPVSIKEYTEL